MKKCKQCDAHIPRTVRIDGVHRNLGSRKYCLLCSPFGQHNTRKLEFSEEPEQKICAGCQHLLPIDSFYHKRRGLGRMSECHACNKNRVRDGQRKRKAILVEEAGGSCTSCGYNKSLNALTFHHLDHTTKSFGIANHLSYNIEELRVEARKCILLCSNCHAEIHDETLKQ